MTMKAKINPREKREELLALWERMFRLCEAQVAKMEAGTLDLTASMLKELNAFMKQSASTLVELEKAQELDEAKGLMECADASFAGDESQPEPPGESEEGDDVMPFPCAAEPVEKPVDPLAVPLEY